MYVYYYFLVVVSGINGLQRIETIFKHLINTSRLPSMKFVSFQQQFEKIQAWKRKKMEQDPRSLKIQAQIFCECCINKDYFFFHNLPTSPGT